MAAAAMDVDVPLDAEHNREENEQLLEIARISKSLAAFEKSLKLKCMERIFENADALHENKPSRRQFRHLSPVLQSEFLDQLGCWADEKEQNWTDAEFERVFSLVKLLLNKHTTQFDFRVLGDKMPGKDKPTWKLLLKRCPKLTRLEDCRDRYPDRGVRFVEGLSRLSHLQHLKLKYYVLDKDLDSLFDQVSPNLRSLAFTLKYERLNYNVTEKLFQLQSLEFLQIGLVGHYEKSYAEYLTGELLHECVRRLPRLQEADVFEGDWYENHAFHNPKPAVLDAPLALQSLRLNGALRGWTVDKLPHVTKLHVTSDLEDYDPKSLCFPNLTVLSLNDTRVCHLKEFVQNCGSRLEDLAYDDYAAVDDGVDLYELFSLCPNLKRLHVFPSDFTFQPDLCPPLSAAHFKNLTSFSLKWDQVELVLPADLSMQILMAPCVEKIQLHGVSLDLEDNMLELTELLQNREILQLLREFSASSDYDTEQNYVTFLKLLAAYLPRLKSVEHDIRSEELVPTYLIDGFEKLGIDFYDM